MFRADDLTPTGKDYDRNEVIEVRWFTREEVKDLILANQVVDNLSLAPLLTVLFGDRDLNPDPRSL
jgi:NADH pyrophosphatase NudC (nudix superfamily)